MKFFLYFFFICSFAWIISAQTEAYCKLQGTSNDPSISGHVKFTVMGNEVKMEVYAQDITVNTGENHGLHVHAYGDISTESGAATGGHYNPDNVAHSCPPNATRHVGDTGNWFVNPNGTIIETKTLDLLQLTGGKSIIGRGIILHEQRDSCAGSAGDAGIRLAQCVIGIANVNGNTAKNEDTQTTKAICVLKETAGNGPINGTVYFSKGSNGVNINAMIYGLNENQKYGFHIHQYGDLSAADGTSLGGHYNPYNKPHAIPDVADRHVGDLGNIFYFDGGVAEYRYNDNELVKIDGSENNVIGRGMVVHAMEDDCGGESGNAGQRIATCVIGIQDTNGDTFSSGAPATQDTTKCESNDDDNDDDEKDSGASNVITSIFLFVVACFLTL